jgi:Phosphotransferase enzyme family
MSAHALRIAPALRGAVPVSDPTGAAADPQLPTLPAALDPAVVAAELEAALPQAGSLRVDAIRVVRHKPGRRCLVEYDVEVAGRDGAREALTLLGKVRRRRSGRSPFELARALWDAGFDGDSPDGISLPEPMGLMAPIGMWLQRRVPGVPATDLLAGPGGPPLAARIADVAHKVHRAGVAPKRTHGMADELRILHEVLPTVVAARPAWDTRIARLLQGCDRLGARVDRPQPCGIHRDFYGDQILVDAERLWVLDFDLYCLGDPALDIGNFLGHMTEQALREHGDPAALSAAESALEEAFLARAGQRARAAVAAYTTLTLVRHVYLSTVLPQRGATTERLLELCERRLDLPTRRAR